MLHFGNTVDNGLGVEMIRLRNPPEVLGCTVRRQHSAAAAVGGDAIRNLFPSVNKAAGKGRPVFRLARRVSAVAIASGRDEIIRKEKFADRARSASSDVRHMTEDTCVRKFSKLLFSLA